MCSASQVLFLSVATLGVTQGQQQYQAIVASVQNQDPLHSKNRSKVVATERFTCTRPRAITVRNEWEARLTIFGWVAVNEEMRGASCLRTIAPRPKERSRGRALSPLYRSLLPDCHAVVIANLLLPTSTSTRCLPIHSSSLAWG